MSDQPSTTSPSASASPAGETPRQRRIATQRQELTRRRRQRQRQQLLVLLLVVVLVAIALAAFLLFVPRPAQAQGYAVPVADAPHVLPLGTPIQYSHDPPSSGDYYDQLAPYGVQTSPVPVGDWMENLAQGAIVVLYNCPQACPNVVQQLTAVYASAPPSVLSPGTVKLVVTPYADLSPPISALAWGWEDDMPNVDQDRLLAFYRTHVDRVPQQAP